MAFLHRHRRLQLALFLVLPLGWLGVIYLGSLGVLFISSFWSLNPLTSAIEHTFTLANYQKILSTPVYRVIVLRTVTVAAAVTITDVVLAFPIAYYMARVARRRTRVVLLMLVALPLWSSYLVRVYAWRVILGDNGPLDWAFGSIGLGRGRARLLRPVDVDHLQLPLAAVHDPAALRRLPATADVAPRGVVGPRGAHRGSPSDGSSCRWSCRRWWPARSSPSR